MRIVQDFIAPGMRHRPMTNPASSLYRRVMRAKYITIHEAWSTANARRLHEYVKTQRAADRPASWHFSIDEKECYQALPLTESGWHAGDNLGPGNTETIGIEICDYGMRRDNDWNLFWEAVKHCAKLCAYLIQNSDSLLPYPECLVYYPDTLKQHWDWSRKNCPALIRNGGHWQQFVDLVGEYLKEEQPEEVIEKDFLYRVVVGSYEEFSNAKEKALEIRKLGPSILGEIVYNDVNGRKLYRVIAAEHDSPAPAKIAVNWLEEKGVSSFIVSGVFEDLPIPEPVDAPEKELVEGYDPDIDRDWIDEHPEEFEDDNDPYEDMKGLVSLIRLLSKKLGIFLDLFGGGEK